MNSAAIALAVARLDRWLDTLRGPGGYGGPVAHWWQQSLVYTGPGLDWRYEGIIAGYLELWQRTQNSYWLAKARRAGDDLCAGQLGDSHFAASGFELNPATAGTPHEAACNVGLLLLAQALREAGYPGHETYLLAAQRNLEAFYIHQLWDADTQAFRDDPRVASFVPNKAATICDALFLLAELTSDEAWVVRYALPTLQHLMRYQISERGSLDGAIAQNRIGTQVVEKYVPIYIARCIPALLRAYQWTDQARYLDAAQRAMAFIRAWGAEDGGFPTVIYPNRQVSCHPAWIAPLGDILRANSLLQPYGWAVDLGRTLQRVLGGQDQSGGIQTAQGFGGQAGGRPAALPDLRDLLHVAGWCDKSFRWLASQVQGQLPVAESAEYTALCSFRGQTMQFRENPELLEITARHQVVYRWRKGMAWAEIATPPFWLR